MQSSRWVARTVAGLIVLLSAMPVLASPMPCTLAPADFSSLLSGNATAIGSPTITDMSNGNLQARVASQAFTDGSGRYAYLYQVENFGTSTNNAAEVFALGDFAGATPSTAIGYLTAHSPEGFVLGQQAPVGAGVDASSGPTISFGFPGWQSPGYAIDPGERSSVLYVLSDQDPGQIQGSLIDHFVGTGIVVGPVPEPATMCLLLAGGLALLKARRVK